MNQSLSQYPKTSGWDKENPISPAIPPNAGNFNRTMSKMSSSLALDTSSPQENDLLAQDRHAVRLPHQGNYSQGSDHPLGEMSLMMLAEYCAQEIDKYRHNEPSDERYVLEIFRRAVTLRDHEAWAILQHQFTENVRFWLARHAYREAALRHENEQDYIDHAFQRFWQAVSDQALTFTSSGWCIALSAVVSALCHYGYLACVRSCSSGEPCQSRDILMNRRSRIAITRVNCGKPFAIC